MPYVLIDVESTDDSQYRQLLSMPGKVELSDAEMEVIKRCLMADSEFSAAVTLAILEGTEPPERVIVGSAPTPEHKTAVQRQKRPHKKNYAREGQNKLRAEP